MIGDSFYGSVVVVQLGTKVAGDIVAYRGKRNKLEMDLTLTYSDRNSGGAQPLHA